VTARSGVVTAAANTEAAIASAVAELLARTLWDSPAEIVSTVFATSADLDAAFPAAAARAWGLTGAILGVQAATCEQRRIEVLIHVAARDF
jgi:chorismate mutase